jgi:hypothetical protein
VSCGDAGGEAEARRAELMTDPKPPQLSLFGRARAARDIALERVEAAADPDWQAQAIAAVRVTAELMIEFISDDVWAMTKLSAPREARALGAVFRHAMKAGWITKTDRVKPSVRSHLSGKPVWRSLIYRSGP